METHPPHSPANVPSLAPAAPSPAAGVSRRALLEGTLMLGGLALLAGCQQAPHGVSSLPPDVWPDPKGPPRPNTPIPSRPTGGGGSGGLPDGVIARANWTNARPDMRYAKPMNGVERITVHHSAVNSSGLLARTEVARSLANIRQSHISRTDNTNGTHWIDIGYHYIIDPAGRIWEGRPVNIEGAHVSQTNPHNLGIMLMGNFNEHRPTSAALVSLDTFVAGQMRRYRVPVRSVYTHRELKPTECPGKYLQQYMQITRLSSGRMAQNAMA